MHFPLKLYVPLTLQSRTDFCLVHYQDDTLQFPSPHWYVFIPTKEDSKFLVIIITSQIEKRMNYYKNAKQLKATKCLVKISNNEFPFLNKLSAINCNETDLLSINEIVHKVDEEVGFKFEDEKIPAYLKKEIVSAILQSPLIPPLYKKYAKAANPI